MTKSPPKLSVIILNYNTGEYLHKCLLSIKQSDYPNFETIIVDNQSTDDSISYASKVELQNSKFQILNSNLGFSHGNNQGVKNIDPEAKYVLFLNPDTEVEPSTFSKIVHFFESNTKVSAATCKIILSWTQQIQKECHRGFPTPWRAFCHFSGISKIFPNSKLFNGYYGGNFNPEISQPIEVCMGSFLMLKKEVGEIIGWWNEKFFFYGEDIDLCYKLYLNNYQLWYCPDTSIVHYHGVSSGLKRIKTNASRSTTLKASIASAEAMRIFYRENFSHKYSPPVFILVMFGIKILETIRIIKAKYL